jgi:predicted HD superfamily hydrolase involved in NAD metabolism
MHPILAELRAQITWTGNTGKDVVALLHAHDRSETAEHCGHVAREAGRIAVLAGADTPLARQAGWLHDVSTIFPVPERIRIAQDLGLEVLREEVAVPMIVHQRLSQVLAQELFGVREQEVLDAVGCHTTLRAHATIMDKVLFVADKLAWDQPGIPPYRDDLLAALEQSVDAAAAFFVRYLWERRETLLVIHPWLREAYLDLSVGDGERPAV